jgi:nicotinate-nucleotide adenylyltransferase
VRIGVLGGSFDPPHEGHLALARAAAAQLGLDRVLLVPAWEPPHKPGGPTIPAARRVAMARAATDGDPLIEVSTLEVDRAGTSYTAETLEQLANDHPGAQLWFIMGADQLEGFAGWSRPERIVELARLAVAWRPGAGDPAMEHLAGPVAAGRIDVVDMPEVPISSTEVRRRLERGEDVSGMVPAPVAALLAPATSP